MKRIIALMILLLFLLTGCKPANVINTTEESTTEKTTENMLPVNILKGAQYARTGMKVETPTVVIIRSREELNRFYEANMMELTILTAESYNRNDVVTDFQTACRGYDEDFFENGYLVFVLLHEGSESVSHEVRSVRQSADKQTEIYIDRIVPEECVDVLAEWCIILELSREQGVANGSDVLLYIDGKLTKNVTFVQDTRLQAYNGQWLDKETAQKQEALPVSGVEITQIYADCFLARSVLALPYQFKFNGSLSEDLCVGDQVVVTCENVWYDQVSERYEADLLTVEQSLFQGYEVVVEKPVIYLYPKEETEVSVKLTADGGLTCTYPVYGKGWLVTASPNGTLTDRNGQTYNYLYWEGKTNTRWDMTRGFCVKGEDTAVFLEQALAKLGLNRREANEFIIYWLPQMEQNPYNIISFQGKDYTDAAALEADPAPDTVIRVFMTWQAVEDYVQIEPQELTAPERTGFTLVEWGGTELS